MMRPPRKQLIDLLEIPLFQGVQDETEITLTLTSLIGKLFKLLEAKNKEDHHHNPELIQELKKFLNHFKNTHYLYDNGGHDLLANFLKKSLCLLQAKKISSYHIIAIIKKLKADMSAGAEFFDLHLEEASASLTKTSYEYSLYLAVQQQATEFLKRKRQNGGATPRRIHQLVQCFYAEHLKTLYPEAYGPQLSDHAHPPAMFINYVDMTLTNREKALFLEQDNALAIFNNFTSQFIKIFTQGLDPKKSTEKQAKDFLKRLNQGLDKKTELGEIDHQFNLYFKKNEDSTYSLLEDRLSNVAYFGLLNNKIIKQEAFLEIEGSKESKATFYLLSDDLESSWVSLELKKSEKEIQQKQFFLDYFPNLSRQEQLGFIKKIIFLPPDKMSAPAIKKMISRCMTMLQEQPEPKILPTFAELGINKEDCSSIQPYLLYWFGMQGDTIAAQGKTREELLKNLLFKLIQESSSYEEASSFIELNNELNFFKDFIWTKQLIIWCYNIGIRNFSGKFENLDLHDIDLSDASFEGAVFSNVTFVDNNTRRQTCLRGTRFKGATIDKSTFSQLVKAGITNFNYTTLRNIDIENVDLTEYTFQNATLVEANLKNAKATTFCCNDLAIIIFSNATFINCELTGLKANNDAGICSTMDFNSLKTFLKDAPKRNLRRMIFSIPNEDKPKFRDLDLNKSFLGIYQVQQLIDCERINFRDLHLSGIKKREKPLRFLKGTEFSGTHFGFTEFAGCDVSEANFRGAHFGDEFSRTQFAGSRYEGLFKYRFDDYEGNRKKSERFNLLSQGHAENAVETFKILLERVYLETPDVKEKERAGFLKKSYFDFFYTDRWNRIKHGHWGRNHIEEVKKLLASLPKELKETDETSAPSSPPLEMKDVLQQLDQKTHNRMQQKGGQLKDIIDFCTELEEIEKKEQGPTKSFK